jgi:hypothetical protein
MINIVSTAPREAGWGGATKVYWNLVRGLEAIGYPYVVDRDLGATRRLWVHNDVFALPGLRRTRAHAVLGPNLFVMPGDIPRSISFDGALYLQPSEWVIRLWKRAGFEACDLEAWPVGIDTRRFAPRSPAGPDRSVLVYLKRRRSAELEAVERRLERMRLAYRVLRFGDYTEEDYLGLLARTSFVVWLGCPESQGIALEEALSCDVPVLVWDATRLEQASAEGIYVFDRTLSDFPVTSAPYFDDTCGIRITTAAELDDALARMRDGWGAFRPRDFVLRHLSLEGQARAFVALWERWGASFEDGLLETPTTEGPLRYRTIETLVLKWQRRFGRRLALGSR